MTLCDLHATDMDALARAHPYRGFYALRAGPRLQKDRRDKCE